MSDIKNSSGKEIILSTEEIKPNITTITLPKSVKDSLEELKIIPREPYSEVILRLITSFKKKKNR